MNELRATVTQIQNLDNLNLVELEHENILLTMINLELDNLKVNDEVILCVNSSHISIAKEFKGEISLSNKLPCTIDTIDKGELLSSLKINIHNTYFTSIITTKSVNRMNLNLGDEVLALIKASDLQIKRILNK